MKCRRQPLTGQGISRGRNADARGIKAKSEFPNISHHQEKVQLILCPFVTWLFLHFSAFFCIYLFLLHFLSLILKKVEKGLQKVAKAEKAMPPYPVDLPSPRRDHDDVPDEERQRVAAKKQAELEAKKQAELKALQELAQEAEDREQKRRTGKKSSAYMFQFTCIDRTYREIKWNIKWL